MKSYLKAAPFVLVLGGLVALGWWLLKDTPIAVLQPAGEIASQQRTILYFTLGLSLLVVVPVFFMLGLFAFKYRESQDGAYTPEWGKSAKLETLWWGIPIVIIAVLGVVTWQTSHSLDPYKPIISDKKALEVQVIALQWKWLFIYPDYKIATVNHLPVPVNTPIHFTLTADAPMSAFWVPSLGSQIYSMNGMSSQLNLIANQTGEYAGYNTNINGKGYADMKFVVRAQPDADFDSWINQSKQSNDKMNEATYATLAQPSIVKTQKTYQLEQPDLYDTILMKYMKGNDSSHMDTTQGQHNSIDHSQHDMSSMDHGEMN